MDKLYLDREILDSFPLELMEKYMLVPLEIKNQTLIVLATSENSIYYEILSLYFKEEIKIVETDPYLIKKKIEELKNASLNPNIFRDSKKVKEDQLVIFLNNLLNQAVNTGATDIHIESYESLIRIRFRINGRLKLISRLSKEDYKSLLTRIKLLARLDIAENRRPQDGRIVMEFLDKSIDVRVAIIPLIYGEKLVLRILDKKQSRFNLSNLGLDKAASDELSLLYNQPYGVILITGPAGSGKTTTLYSLLQELNDTSKNIITIEDPVEYTMEGINQSQVNERLGYTFHKSFKSILRQDPNIIMIGEIRDQAVGRLALESGITGHLILSTIHTNNTVSGITRLRSMDIPNYLISEALLGIVSQRLIPILCPRCKIKRPILKKEAEDLGLEANIHLYQASTCAYCHEGYTRRQLVVEILRLDKKLRQLIADNESIDRIEAYVLSIRTRDLKSSVADLVIKGLASIDEFYKVGINL